MWKTGGTLVIGCRSGYKDKNGRCVMMPQPGLLAEITGSDVRDFTFASPAEEKVWALCGEEKIEMPLFNDVPELHDDSEAIAVYGNKLFCRKSCNNGKDAWAGEGDPSGKYFFQKKCPVAVYISGDQRTFCRFYRCA